MDTLRASRPMAVLMAVGSGDGFAEPSGTAQGSRSTLDRHVEIRQEGDALGKLGHPHTAFQSTPPPCCARYPLGGLVCSSIFRWAVALPRGWVGGEDGRRGPPSQIRPQVFPCHTGRIPGPRRP
jgi:hypothetical protein